MTAVDEGPADGPRPAGVLESSLYCPDLEAAERFYRYVMGLELIGRRVGRHVFLRCGEGMVLLFDPEATAGVEAGGDTEGRDATYAAGREDPNATTGEDSRDRLIEVPSHGAHGPGHLAFRVPEQEIERWRSHLEQAGVAIEAEVRWPGGGHSLYVRDPAGNSIELATAAVWGLAPCPS